MSTPFRLPKLVGRKHVVASAVQEIPQFECSKLHVRSTLAEEALVGYFSRNTPIPEKTGSCMQARLNSPRAFKMANEMLEKNGEIKMYEG